MNALDRDKLLRLSRILAQLVPFLPSHCEHLFQLCVSNLTNPRRGQVSLRFSPSLSVSLAHSHAHTRTKTRTHMHTHAHTHALALTH